MNVFKWIGFIGTLGVAGSAIFLIQTGNFKTGFTFIIIFISVTFIAGAFDILRDSE